MLFEDSPFSKSLDYKKIVLDFGCYFLFDNYFIIEVNEGVHLDIDKLNILLESIRSNYTNHKKLAFITNRVYCYSIDPVLWSYCDKDDTMLIAACIVTYRKSTLFNANIEKQMAEIPIEPVSSLEEAFNWVQALVGVS